MDLLTHASGREFSGTAGVREQKCYSQEFHTNSRAASCLSSEYRPWKAWTFARLRFSKWPWSRSQDSQLANVLLEVMFSFSVMLNGTILLTLQFMSMIDSSMEVSAEWNLLVGGRPRWKLKKQTDQKFTENV